MIDVPIRIVGIDSATDPQRVGVATGHFSELPIAITATYQGPEPVGAIVRWVQPREPVLFALDAPLGWPVAMGERLVEHRAGQRLPVSPDHLFSRRTDHDIRERFGKKPLEVGANFIARTALAALTMLDKLRQAYQLSIPLAWDPGLRSPMETIEVYPAATLLALGISPQGYKPKAAHREREALIPRLTDHLRFDAGDKVCAKSPDLFDAAICVLAGADFLGGRAAAPRQLDRAKKEGWIWVRDRVDST